MFLPQVGGNYICFYKQSSVIHPLEPGEAEAMYERVLHDDHNCDTFYFGFVRAAKAVAEFLKNLFRV